ncbi:MAG: hypothetical protein IPJ82_08360 [Lewinellaceae bacterium]|nr:hypothetical protein [Lewinellaceae bacterium]
MRNYILQFLFLLTLAPCSAGAQQADSRRATIFEQLTEKEGVEMTLETDLTTFIGQKRTNNYLPGKLLTKDGKSYEVEIRPRGRYRRKVSQIPPMKIRFSHREMETAGLDSLNEIKIALPAFDSEAGNELIVKEYLAYRLFEKLSDAHFRARLIKLTIKDTFDPKSKPKKMYAIFVEDEEEVAARLGGVPEEEFGVPIEQYETQQAALVAMFQYLIGNTDWDFSMHRNVQLIKMKETGKITVLPYDFDFSGFVSAPYAVPSSDSGLKTVRERFLMPSGLDTNALNEAVKLIKIVEQDLYPVCRSKFISKPAAGDMVKFLESYFKNMDGKDTPPVTMKN